MAGRHNNFEEKKSLSMRENKVMKFVIQGLNNKEIAEILNVSVLTIKKHLDNIYYKYNLRGECLRTRAVLHYLKEKGLIWQNGI